MMPAGTPARAGNACLRRQVARPYQAMALT